jgi:hypothetical protein
MRNVLSEPQAGKILSVLRLCRTSATRANNPHGLAGGDSLYALLRRRGDIPGRKPARKGKHLSPALRRLRRRTDELRDQGVPIISVANLMGLTVEAVEDLLQSPR